MKLKLTSKFIISLVIMAFVLSMIISFFSYYVSKRYYEDMYTYRVINGSKTIAKMLSVSDVKEIISENGDQTEAYERTYQLLNDLKKEGEITFLSMVVPQADRVTFYIDTYVESMGDDINNLIPYGYTATYEESVTSPDQLERYYENWETFRKNEVVEKTWVVDNIYGYNFSSVYPIFDENGVAIAQIQYILDMQSVRDWLNSFLYTMLAISFVIVLIASFCYFVYIKKSVTTPIARLVKFTREVARNEDFAKTKIELHTGDEIEELGNAFNSMLSALDDHIKNLAAVTAEKQRIGAELDVATRIQASMLPCIFPAFPEREEFEVYATMTPAKEVGGDFYDFFMVDEENLAVAVADVSGKGVPAALFMVIGKTLIKDHTVSGKNLGDVFTEVNTLLCEANSGELFITAFVGVLNLKSGEFRYVNAGHEPPFLSKNGGAFALHKIPAAFVLAGMEGVRYKEGVFHLEPGDKIFLYTDGVVEAEDLHHTFFGMERLQASLSNASDQPPEAVLAAVKQDIDSFAGDAPQFDDITMLCMEFKKSTDGNEGRVVTAPSIDAAAELTAYVETTLEEKCAPVGVIAKMSIALDEIYSNIVKFSGAGYAKIVCGVENDNTAYLIFEDNGMPYNPMEQEDPDITLSAEEREIGGLGIFMVKKSMTSMDYKYVGGKNHLTLKLKY